MDFWKQNPYIFSVFYFSHIMLSLSFFFSLTMRRSFYVTKCQSLITCWCPSFLSWKIHSSMTLCALIYLWCREAHTPQAITLLSLILHWAASGTPQWGFHGIGFCFLLFCFFKQWTWRREVKGKGRDILLVFSNISFVHFSLASFHC